MDNPEKLATYGTQDEEKQKHNTIFIGYHYAHTNTNTSNINKTCALLQANWTNRTSLYAYFQLLIVTVSI
jgi:hypothetical protein